jgi:general secretion pathway protein C
MNAASWLDAIPGSEKWRALIFARGPRLATWALGIALGVQAALIVTNVAGADRGPTGAMMALSAGPHRTAVDIAAITNGHLFGFAPGASGPASARNAPETSMPLVLTGVIAANDPRDGLAILGPNAGSAKVYAVGDSIPGGASLHAVLADHVLLERDGHLESLALPRQLPGGGLSGAPPSLSAAPTSAPLIERMRQLVTEHPGIIGDVMRPEPVFAGGHQVGYRVYPGRDRQAFQSLGLQPGDLVTAIDGAQLDDPSQSGQILQTLASSSEAQVTILRDGKQQDLTLNLAQVEQEAESLAGPQNGAGNRGMPQRALPPPMAPFSPPRNMP